MSDAASLLESVAPDGPAEFATPAHYAALVRAAFGGRIACDPASSDADNEVIRAEVYFTHSRSGLAGRPWPAPFYLNPPAARRAEFVERAGEEAASGARCIVRLNLKHLCNDYAQTLMKHVTAIHIPAGRPAARGRSGSPADGCAFLYCGQHPTRFCAAFVADKGWTVLTARQAPRRAPRPRAEVV